MMKTDLSRSGELLAGSNTRETSVGSSLEQDHLFTLQRLPRFLVKLPAASMGGYKQHS
jgi:hypothetical protein